MKIQIKYDIVIMDDEGNLLVDAKDEGNFNDIGKLVATVIKGVETVEGIVKEHMKRESDQLYKDLVANTRDRVTQ